jgi:hypothetical protein
MNHFQDGDLGGESIRQGTCAVRAAVVNHNNFIIEAGLVQNLDGLLNQRFKIIPLIKAGKENAD